MTSFGRDTTFDKVMQYKRKGFVKGTSGGKSRTMIRIKEDQESIVQGKTLFDAKCSICHDANSTQTIVGPGLKGVLKKPRLPVSDRPATPENIRSQLKMPFNRMPSFEYLSDDEIHDIIAFLNTL
ncbi:cytochrome c [bacterium]|nr:MAG: cytochrome c [bacterium]